MDNFVIDGCTHCLWWTDSHIEIAFTTPTERVRKQQTCVGNRNLLSSCGANISLSSDERIDPDHAARILRRDFSLFLQFLAFEIFEVQKMHHGIKMCAFLIDF